MIGSILDGGREIHYKALEIKVKDAALRTEEEKLLFALVLKYFLRYSYLAPLASARVRNDGTRTEKLLFAS